MKQNVSPAVVAAVVVVVLGVVGFFGYKSLGVKKAAGPTATDMATKMKEHGMGAGGMTPPKTGGGSRSYGAPGGANGGPGGGMSGGGMSGSPAGGMSGGTSAGQ